MKRTRLLTRIAIVVTCLSTLAFLIVGAVFHWTWAGFDKPLYDWMQLLIIPTVLALIAVWFNRIDKKNELTIAQKRADDEQARTQDNQRESALQSYFDRMSELVLKENLDISQPTDKVRTVARARTLTVLPSLDAVRRNNIIQFLSESQLIKIINLSGADLNGTNLSGADLSRANLSRANLSRADLNGADLNGADLSGADLSRANLYQANLSEANLYQANLSEANLYQANLKEADLKEAALSGAYLCNADLKEANLSGADFNNANLSGADFNNANLKSARINPPSRDKATLTKEQIAYLQQAYP